jgi:hypothetical protein
MLFDAVMSLRSAQRRTPRYRIAALQSFGGNVEASHSSDATDSPRQSSAYFTHTFLILLSTPAISKY